MDRRIFLAQGVYFSASCAALFSGVTPTETIALAASVSLTAPANFRWMQTTSRAAFADQHSPPLATLRKGHTAESYSEPADQVLPLVALKWAIRREETWRDKPPANSAGARP